MFRKRKAVPVIEAAPAGSLAEALAVVPDPRRPYGWRPGHEPIPLVALLQLTVVALLCGAPSQLAVAQWGRERLEDDPGLLEALGVPPGRSPCVATLHRVYKQLDVAAFEAALGAWLVQIAGKPPRQRTATPARVVRAAVAIDGKVLRGSQPKREDRSDSVPGIYLVAAYTHASGVVLGQIRVAGQGHELAAAKALLDPGASRGAGRHGGRPADPTRHLGADRRRWGRLPAADRREPARAARRRHCGPFPPGWGLTAHRPACPPA